MISIHCTQSCLYENEGNCTLTHVTSVTNSTNHICAYYKEKNKPERKPLKQ